MTIETARLQSASPPAGISASDGAGGLVLRAEGDWVVASATELDRSLHALRLPHGRRITLDLSGIGPLVALPGSPDRVVPIDLVGIRRSIAGPGMPHLRKDTAEVARSFFDRLSAMER